MGMQLGSFGCPAFEVLFAQGLGVHARDRSLVHSIVGSKLPQGQALSLAPH